MRSPRRPLWRHLSPFVAAALGLSGLGVAGLVTAGPAAALPAPTFSLAVATPLPGTAAGTLYDGQPVSYQLTVTAGSGAGGDISGVTVTDAQPADLSFVSASGTGWSCLSAVSCSLTGNLTAGSSTTLTVLMKLANAPVGNPAGSETFTPTIKYNDSTNAPQSSVQPALVTPVAPAADIALTKVLTSAPGASPVTYTLNVTNAGPDAAAAPVITDTLPAGMSFGSADAGCANAPTPQTITCTAAGPLAAGPTALTYHVSLNATPGARLTTGASVVSATFDYNKANNAAVPPAGPYVAYGNAADPGPCTLVLATATVTRTCNLVAGPAVINPFGVSLSPIYNNIPVWGFGVDTGQAIDQANLAKNTSITMPGPTLVANEGETLDLVVRNELPIHVGSGTGAKTDNNLLAVQIPGMTSSHPDDVGVPSCVAVPGSCKTALGSPSYTWTLTQPGTYIYEAAQGQVLTSNGARQLAMGLSGLLVVRPKNFTPGGALQALFDPAAGAAPVAPLASGGSSSTSTTTSTSAAPATTTTSAAPVSTTTSAAPVSTTTSAAPVSTTTSAAPVSTTTSAAPTTTTTVAPATPAASGGAVVHHGAPVHTAPLSAPAPGTACASPATSSAFTAEALVQLDELSAEFHGNPWTSLLTPGGGNGAVPVSSQDATNPGGSPDVANYAPDVFLINGQAYPNTQTLAVAGTDCVVLHYANLGMLEKSLGVGGLRETVMADDSFPSTHPQSLATKYINPGEGLDAVVDMGNASVGAQFPIVDYERHLNNGPGSANSAVVANSTGMTLGGQVEVLQVAGVDPPAANPAVDTVNWASDVNCNATTLSPQQTIAVGGGASLTPSDVFLNVHGNPSASITGAEWSVDNIVPAGTGHALATGNGCNDVKTSDLTATLAPPFPNGDHLVFVRVQQGAVWSDAAGVVFTFDNITNGGGGPVLTNFSLSPSATNHTATTPNKYVGAGAACPGTPQGPGVPVVSCDVVIDGTATPALSDWTISGVNWSIDGVVPYMASPVAVPACSATVFPPGCTTGAGAAVEIYTPIPQSTVAPLADDKVYTVNVVVTETNGSVTRTSNPISLSLTKVGTGPTTSFNAVGARGTQVDPPVNPPYAGPSTDNSANLNNFTMVRISGNFADAGGIPAANAPIITGGEMTFAPVCPSVGASKGWYKGKPCPMGQPIGYLNLAGTAWTPVDPTKPAPSGSGVPVTPDDGLWTNQPGGKPVNWNVAIPSIDFNGFPQGAIAVYVHGKDQSGTWGVWKAFSVELDKTPPTNVSATASAGTAIMKVTATDPLGPGVLCTNATFNLPAGCGGDPASSTIRMINWFIPTSTVEAPEGAGSWYQTAPSAPPGTDTMTIPVDLSPGGPLAAGDKVGYRVMDGAGNWTDWYTVTVGP